MNDEQQTQQADDPSDDRYWRNVLPSEILQPDDMMRTMAGLWLRTTVPGKFASDGCGRTYRRRIEPQQPSDSEPETMDYKQCVKALQQIAQLADTGSKAHKERFCPNGESDGIANGWRVAEAMREVANNVIGGVSLPQPSDSEPETMQDLRRRLAECEVLLAEAEISGEQVNARLQQLREQARDLTRQTQVDALELQQSREQVQTLTRERDRYRNQLAGAIEHSKAPEAQAQLVDRLQAWLRPVLEVVADHPDHSSILAASVLEFLPQIASRLIEE